MKKNILHIAFLIISITILLSEVSNAQILSIKTYTSDDGLPQNSVYDIYQDAKGFLWFATENGISRYDGMEFVNYDQADGLIYNNVHKLFNDSNGNLWLTTKQGISKFDGKVFTNYTEEDGLSDEFVYSVIEDTLGRIWAATLSGGINIIDTNGITYLNTDNGFPTNNTRSLLLADDGSIWCGTMGSGAVKISGSEFTVFDTESGLVNDTVVTIFQADNGDLYFGTYNGLSVYNGNRINTLNDDKNTLSIRINEIVVDKDGNFWFATNITGGQTGDGGLIYYDGDEFTKYTTENGISSGILYCIIEDQRGDIWFGTHNGGVNRLAVEKFLIFNKESGLADNSVYSIFKDSKGNTWFGHFGSGLTKYDGTNYTYFTQANGLPSNAVSSIAEDRDGNLWFGTSEGVAKYSSGRFTNYNMSDGLVSDLVLSILVDFENNIWFGCDAGVSKYNSATGRISSPEEFKDVFGKGWVYYIYEDFEGILWFGTELQGVIKYNGRRFDSFGVDDGLPVNEVMHITQDKLGNFWFSTYGGGVTRFDGEKFQTINSSKGLAGNSCYFMVEHGNYFFVGTNQGVARFEYAKYNDLSEYKPEDFKTYTIKDGFAANEVNMGAVFKDSKLNIYFGTQSGVTRFNPNDKPRFVASPVYFTNVKIIDDEVETDTIPSGELELDYTENNLSIDYRGITFASRQKLLYRVKLDPVDNKWSETVDHQQSFRSLPPNEYTFNAMVKNADGVWSETAATVSFIITPPFWETWWFRALLILTFIFSVYAVYVVKTRQVKRRNIELANMVRERTKELEKEKNKSDDLLHNILPASAVQELKSHGFVQPREFRSTTILFTDFKGFTSTASILPADKLVDELNEIFLGFDKIMEEFELEKLKTIGDSYMAAGGLPYETEDHAIKVVMAALKMQDFIINRNNKAAMKWDMRCGIHSGTVVAGVVGTKKFTYDIWGDTVNIASRMESSGEPGKVNISAFTYMLVRDYFECEYRGKIDAKGKGEMDMYFIKEVKDNIHEVINIYEQYM